MATDERAERREPVDTLDAGAGREASYGTDRFERNRALDWVALVLGIWLFIVPLVNLAGLDDTGLWNHYLTGLAIITVSAIALYSPHRWQNWAYALLGAWAFVSPFALDFWEITWSTANHAVVGALVAAMGVSNIVRRQYAERHPTTVY